MELAANLADAIGQGLPKLNMGGGFGIPYFPGDQAVDLARVRRGAGRAGGELAAGAGGQRALCRTRRYLVGEAGVYLTR